jgi:protein SCO1
MNSATPFWPLYKLPVFLLAISLLFAQSLYADNKRSEVVQKFQYKTALQSSQDAIGHTLSKHRFTDVNGKGMTMHDFLGKPLIISMVYTSCYQICPMTIRHLSKVVEKARDTLGKDNFSIAVIGFDTQFDTPQKMKHFANKQGIDKKDWYALSADADTIAALTKELGFVYFASPNGFDHVVQATVVDEKGEIYRQVYGETFETQLLVEPMLDLILDRPKTSQSFLSNMANKIRFFCTTYDPRSDSYHFDYSLFVGMAIGFSIILLTIIFMVRELRYAKRHPRV